METRELREIFQRAIKNTLTASVLVGLVSCASEKEPTSPIATPTTTATSKPIEVTPVAASTPTTQVTSASEPIITDEDMPSTGMGRNEPRFSSPPYGYERYDCKETISGVTPKTAPDYMELASYGQSTGEACKTAKSATKCQDALKKAKTKNPTALLVTQGNEVLVVTKKNVKKFLGGAENAQEAALIVSLNGLDICSEGMALKEDTSAKYKFELSGRSCSFDMSYSVEVSKAGDYKLIGKSEGHPCRGRRPEGLCELEKKAHATTGEFFAEAAWQEAVSVPAFVTLARDLRLLNAPAHLIEAALDSADDEVRHAKQMTQLAARFGGAVEVPNVDESQPKNLLALALENEREGCVNETFAALLAWYQAETASDSQIKQELRQIAEDETRHSQLSFAVRRWLLPQLTQTERLLVEETRQQTIERLRSKLEVLPEEVATTVGWPSLSQSQHLLQQLQETMWS